MFKSLFHWLKIAMLKKLVFTETSLQGPKERALPKNLVVTLQNTNFFQRPKKRSLKTLTLTDFKERFFGSLKSAP
jgi:hypothetical protein